MKPWRWFVGQVARLRRSIAGVAALRRRSADDAISTVDEPRTGPPEHWLEKVRLGAPGLLEPSFRQQRSPAEEPVSPHIAPPANDLESAGSEKTVLEDEELETEPTPRRREAALWQKAPLLRKVLRQERPPSVVETPLAPVADVTPIEPRPIDQPRDAPTAEPPSRRLELDEPETHEPDRSPTPPEVVELEAPAQRRPARVEQVPARGLQSTTNGDQLQHVAEEIRTERVWERAVPSPAPRSEPAVQHLPEPAVQRIQEPAVPRPTPHREPPVDPRPAQSRPAEPLSSVDVHPWPELPTPLDHPDTEVEAALRAWEHQQRLDREQTRL